MNNYDRNDPAIYAMVLGPPKRRRMAQRAAWVALALGGVAVVGVVLWYVCFGVWVQG